jgi:mannonate dehydratase
MSAIAAVDTALWDIKAKAAGMPLYQLLGGASRDRVMVYAHANGRDIEHTVDEVLRHRALGYKAIRAQSGVPGLEKVYGVASGDAALRTRRRRPAQRTRLVDREVPAPRAPLFDAVRRAVGDDVHLLHDVHHRLTPIEAARLGKDLEPFRLFWLEDATPAENQDAFRLIRQHTTTPLAVGEVFNTLWDCKDLIENQLIDYIRATVVHAGGITHLRRIADLAALYQVRTGCHGATDLSPVCMGAALHFDLWVPNFGIQEHMPHTDETDAVFPHAYRFERRLHAPGRGAGPRRRHRRGAGREVPLPARLPAGQPPAARRHAVALVRTCRRPP